MADNNRIASIVRDPAAYGSKGENWHPDFVEYMVEIVTHPAYAGMPDAIKEDGKIQWEAPSNRKSGQYQHTHHRRRDWWRDKARSIGIDPEGPEWISTTAKRIHPTGEKPCKRCGRVMRISYAYPNHHLQRRLSRLSGEDFQYDPLEPIDDLIQRLTDTRGERALEKLPELLSTATNQVPNLGPRLDEWLAWIEEDYIPTEPSLLSPGAMSNAPDRFDGFHSFNLCCRSTADRGRHESNLRAYSTDRRVFEYWSEGDWIAADRLMGMINSQLRDHPCADGGAGPCTADHIGPLSLGFVHRPEFRLLSKAANSAKNNRMTLADVRRLLAAERTGQRVISWHAEALWEKLKGKVYDEETALRISKLLRDNQRNAMYLLSRLIDAGHLVFLSTLLGLHYADRNVEFENLRVDSDFVTVFDELVVEARTTKYATEQKARRLRVAFEALRAYGLKVNRHTFIVEDDRIEQELVRAPRLLARVPAEVSELDRQLADILFGHQGVQEEMLREIAQQLTLIKFDRFSEARDALGAAMTVVAEILGSMWDDDRYVRAPFDFDNDSAI